jgi:hypothetical protein
MRFLIRKFVLIVCALAFLGGPGAVYAAPIPEIRPSQVANGAMKVAGDPVIYLEEKFVAMSSAVDDRYGCSVALSGDGNVRVVGICQADPYGDAERGAAYFYTWAPGGGWNVAVVTASDGKMWDMFGNSVAVSADGSTAVVGAYLADVNGKLNQGAVYVFRQSGGNWFEVKKLTASDGAAQDQFGYAVAVSADGGTILVGSPWDDMGVHQDQGSVYVFKGSGATLWDEKYKLTASDGASSTSFGYSVALSNDGTTAAVGAEADDIGANQDQGSAYIFNSTGDVWSQQPKLIASDGAAGDIFGVSISLAGDGNTVLVGAQYAMINANSGQGAGYIFTRTAGVWGGQQKLIASDGLSNHYFGISAALSADGSTALLGAIKADFGGNSQTGAAYLFKPMNGFWGEWKKLGASDGEQKDSFGYRVAISTDGKTALVGAYRNGAISQGAAYLYTYDAPPTILSIQRVGLNPTNETSLKYTVTFSEAVNGVDPADFVVSSSGAVSGAAVSGIDGSGTVYTVTVSSGKGLGTLRLDVPDTAVINDGVGNLVANRPFSGPEFVKVYKFYWPLVSR